MANPKETNSPVVRADQIRAAVEEALASGVVRDRAQEIADEFVNAASRVRELFEGSVGAAKSGLEATESAVRHEFESLEKRIDALEKKVGLPGRSSRKPAAKKPAAKKPAAAKPAARKPAAKKPAAKKPAAAKPAAKKPAARKPAAKKPAAAAKPAAKQSAASRTTAATPAAKRG